MIAFLFRHPLTMPSLPSSAEGCDAPIINFPCYSVCMKRTNLVLDEALLEEATRVLGVKTYSAAVNRALEEAIKIKKIQSLSSYFGTRLWEGDLSEMREDKGGDPFDHRS